MVSLKNKHKVKKDLNNKIESHSALKDISTTLSLIGLFGGFLFLFSQGSIQLSPGEGIFNWKLWLGIILLIVALVFSIFWVKSENKSKKRK
jgi:hypothetical protein